jgi:hypothetical protein
MHSSDDKITYRKPHIPRLSTCDCDGHCNVVDALLLCSEYSERSVRYPAKLPEVVIPLKQNLDTKSEDRRNGQDR